MNLLNNTNFTSRETYLAWRQQWRLQYALISELIRVQKRTLKAYHRSKAHNPENHYEGNVDVADLMRSQVSTRLTEPVRALVVAELNALIQQNTFVRSDKVPILLHYKSYGILILLRYHATRALALYQEAKVKAQQQYLANKQQLKAC